MRLSRRTIGVSILFSLFLTVLLAIIFTWHRRAHYYPRFDSAYYFQAAQEIYDNVMKGDVLGTLKKSYFVREYKPILHPHMIVPFLFLTGGKVLAAIAASSMFFFCLFYFFVFLTLTHFVGGLAACVGAFFICSFGWAMSCAQVPMPELPQLAATMAVVYFMLKSEYFQNVRASVGLGIALAVCFCIRPIEAFVLLSVPLVLWVREGVVRKAITRDALVATGLGAILPLLTLLLPIALGRDLPIWGTFLGILVIAASMHFVYRRTLLKKNSQGYALCFILGYGLTVLWFLPSMMAVYQWVFAATFGASTRSEVNGVPVGLRLFSRAYNEGGGRAFFISAIAALISAVFPRVPALKRPQNLGAFALEALPIAGAGLWMAFGPLLLGSFAYNQDTRYYLPGITVALLTTSALILNPKWRFVPLRALPLLYFAGINVMLSMENAQMIRTQDLDIYKVISHGAPFWRVTDPMITMVKEVEEATQGKPATIGLMPLYTAESFDESFEPSALPIILSERKSPLAFQGLSNPPNHRTMERKDAILTLLNDLSSVDYVLIGPEAAYKVPNARSAPFGDLVLELYKTNALGTLNLKLEKRLVLTDNANTSHALLLLKRVPPQ